jgi:hypothetical protein
LPPCLPSPTFLPLASMPPFPLSPCLLASLPLAPVSPPLHATTGVGPDQQQVDDITDLNDGEKTIMKLWSLHVLRYWCPPYPPPSPLSQPSLALPFPLPLPAASFLMAGPSPAGPTLCSCRRVVTLLQSWRQCCGEPVELPLNPPPLPTPSSPLLLQPHSSSHASTLRLRNAVALHLAGLCDHRLLTPAHVLELLAVLDGPRQVPRQLARQGEEMAPSFEQHAATTLQVRGTWL